MKTNFAYVATTKIAVVSRWLLGITLIFNLLDTVWTLIVVLAGWAVEVNPLMAELLAHGPLSFVMVKMGLVSLGVWVLWHALHHPLAVLGTWGVGAAYACLMFYHAASLSYLLA